MASGSVELVTSRMAAHHFPGFESMLDEVARVLNQGGVFLMADSIAPADDAVAAWLNDIELRRDFSHIQDRQERHIEALVEERGLKVTAEEPHPDWAMVQRLGGEDCDFSQRRLRRCGGTSWRPRTPSGRPFRLHPRMVT